MANRIPTKKQILWLTTLLLMLSVCIPAAMAATQATYYVSPTGSDSNAGTQSAPFQTITKARDVVRTINSSMSGDIYVYLRGGTFDINSTITFTPQDSGTNGYRIYYQAYTGEQPVLNGGTLVTGWTQQSGNIYKATLNQTTKLRSLVVNDKRAYMASKNANGQGSWGTYSISAGQGSWAWISGSKADGVKYNTGDIAVLANAGDVEIINSTTWNQNIVCVREITTEGTARILKLQQPMGAIAMNQGWNAGFSASGSHKIQNAYEFLDTAGEFYFNKATSTLYYYKGSEDMSTAVVYAPKLRTLIDITGTSKTSRVRNITFKGITFANTEAELPQIAGSSGKTSVQSSTWCVAFANSNLHADKYRAYDVMLGAINVTSADAIDFTENTLKHIGNEGISLINDASNCTILGNSITDIGGSGIQVGHPQHLYEGDGGTHEKYSAAVEGICKNNILKNNYIYNTTTIYMGHQGITAYFVEGLNIEHNQIEGTNYGGVSVGWGWCNFDATAVPGNPTSTCKNNKFNNNRVFDCMKTLSDSGAFYTLGTQPNSQANNNYVKASTTHFQGVYHPDEGTAYYTGNNLVFDIVPGQDNFELNDWGRKHDNHYDNIYTTSSSQQTGAPNCTITNLHVYPSSASFPQAALDIINNAGLEAAYKYLLPGNGTPPPLTPTPLPTPTPGPLSAFAQIEAENFTTQSGIQTETCSEGGQDVGYIENGDYLVFNNLNFANGAISFQARTASATSGGSIELRLDSSTGTLIGTCAVAGNGDWQTWITASCNVNGVSGTHNLYLVFTGSSGYLFNFNWFKFIAAAAPTPTVTQTGIKGDVNDDKQITIVDALMIAQYSVGLAPAGFITANADVNCDGNITIVDALIVAQYYVGLLTSFPC